MLALVVLAVLFSCAKPALSQEGDRVPGPAGVERPASSDKHGQPEQRWVPSTWGISGFAAFLLGLAIIPLAAPRWWEHNRHKALFTAVLAAPFAAYVLLNDGSALIKSLHEYFQFLTLLFSLFVIAGGIWLSGDLRSTPRNNMLFLALGSVLASFIGTTGACMLLIRPLLSTNKERKHVKHTVIFFIFLVANIGGALTPLGDPPLFLGYLRGVPFLWTFRLWKMWLPAGAVLLVLYYIFDSLMWKRETEAAKSWDAAAIEPLQLRGGLNFLFLLGVMAATFFDPAIKRLLESMGLAENVVEWVPTKEAVMLFMTYLSWKTTKMEFRKVQNFSFNPIIEVAVLFLGVFITMIPALMILHHWGPTSPIKHPWQFFWAAGGLSSVLDNAPTYLTFFSLGLGQGNPEGMAQIVVKSGVIKEVTLLAISSGAVFMGANTYIGNAPNFMVKAIAENSGVKMPSFFGYTGWSLAILIPLFILLTLIFYR